MVVLLRATSDSYLKEKDRRRRRSKALTKAARALSAEDYAKVIVEARELARDIPSYKISAFREKHEMACKGEAGEPRPQPLERL